MRIFYKLCYTLLRIVINNMQTTSISITAQELKSRLDSFENECRVRGLRVTNQRRVIFRTVASSREHPSAETVFLQVRKTLPNVSLDTVYRTLASLEQMGLVFRMGLASKARFDADLKEHYHFVCMECGEVYDAFPPQDEHLTVPDALKALGDIKNVNLQTSGVCTHCRKNLKK